MAARYPRYQPLRRSVPLMAVALSGSWVACADPATQRVPFAIPAGPAAVSLAAFSKDTQFDYLFLDQTAGEVTTNPVNGDFTPTEALAQMMAGTSLTFTMADERTVTLRNCVGPCKPIVSSDLGEQTAGRNRDAAVTTHELPARRDAPLEQVYVDGFRKPVEDFTPQPSLQQIVVSKQQLDQRGAITLPDALKFMTQVLDGGVTEGNIQNGREAGTNGNHASGVNVRGLGPAATLILLDGHRTVRGGTDAMYTESDIFPTTGLQSVELLLDGPPLRYGGDAIGGVINIVMNRQFTGRNTEFQSNGLTADGRHEYKLGHFQGWKWGETHIGAAVELRQQDALPANKRNQYTNDLTRFGGNDFRTPYGQPGTLLVGDQMYAIPLSQDGNPLTPASFVPNTENLSDQLSGSDVLPRQRRWNLYFDLDRELGDQVTGTAEALCSYRQVTDNVGSYAAVLTVDERNPFYINPTGGSGPINIFYRFARELGSTMERARVTTCDSTLALEAKDLGGWHFNGSVGYSTERQSQVANGLVDFPSLENVLLGTAATAFNPFGDGSRPNTATIDSFRSSSHYQSRSDLWDLQVNIDRRLFPLRSRDVTLGLGAEYRTENLTARTHEFKSAPEIATDLTRNIYSSYAELTIPIPGHATFTASGRFDRYSDFGSVLTPEYTLTWLPSRSISIRATWARLFRPPNISQLIENNNVSQLTILPDTQARGGTIALIDSGNNSRLKQERSRNWGIKLVLSPPTLPDFRASLDYYHDNSRNRIEDPPFEPNVLDDPRYRSMVTRNPTAAQRQGICNNSRFAGSLASCLSSPVGAIVDLRTRNTSILTTGGLDLATAYAWHSAWGELEVDLMGTYIFDYSIAPTADAPKVQLRSTPNNPVDLRVRPMLQWRLSRLTTLVAANYWNHYRDTVSIPNRNVASWTTLDTQVSYRVDGLNGSLLDGTEILLTASNLLGRDPPFVNNQLRVGYDLTNGNLRGRVVGFTLRKQW
jgi:iron complex outermembrane recepter protein